jgi:hypothetical protein
MRIVLNEALVGIEPLDQRPDHLQPSRNVSGAAPHPLVRRDDVSRAPGFDSANSGCGQRPARRRHLQERESIRHGVCAGGGEHDNQVAIAEVTERMGKPDVSRHRLHVDVTSDHAETSVIREPAKQR